MCIENTMTVRKMMFRKVHCKTMHTQKLNSKKINVIVMVAENLLTEM